jgi:FeS assembly SUF system regulator
MMRLSRFADYAVLLMTHIARHPDRSHTAAEVARAAPLPAPTAARVLARLCRHGLLTSTRGVKGGYMLARSAARISVGAIVSALDGPVSLTRCVKPGPGHCEVEAVCPSRVGLHYINVAVRKALDEVSLAEIAAVAGVPPGLSRQVAAEAHREGLRSS